MSENHIFRQAQSVHNTEKRTFSYWPKWQMAHCCNIVNASFLALWTHYWHSIENTTKNCELLLCLDAHHDNLHRRFFFSCVFFVFAGKSSSMYTERYITRFGVCVQMLTLRKSDWFSPGLVYPFPPPHTLFVYFYVFHFSNSSWSPVKWSGEHTPQ